MSIKKEASKDNTGSKKKAVCIGILVIALVIVAGCLCAVFANKAPRTDANGEPIVKIKTSYLPVWYPEKYEQYLKYEEIRNEADLTVVFSMVYDEIEAELFRLSFTAEAPEEYAGYFTVDGKELYVAIKPSGFDHGIFGMDHAEENLDAQEEIQSLYYSMLDGITTVMDSVRKDKRFSEIGGISGGEKREQALSYWKISIPSQIICDESERNGVYQATFSGHIGNKVIDLYTISLGDSNAESIVGQYVTNGESRTVSVKLHSIDADALSDEELETAYAMMDTINDVLQAIRQDKNFYEQLDTAA